MRARPGHSLSILVVAVGVVLGLGLVLVVEPSAEPMVLLAGVAAGLFLYGAMYVAERRRHW